MDQLNGLCVRVWGEGDEAIVLLHGSNTADPGAVWARQRELAGSYRLLVPDRRGYGRSAALPNCDFEVGVRDALALLGDGAHLVGMSYGGLVAMLAAARRPDLIHSLTLIEPPAFGVARGQLDVDRLMARLVPLYAAAPRSTPEAFIAGFVRALGQEIDEPVQLSPLHRRAVQATMDEPPPWEANIPLDTLAQAPFPKLVVSGDWHPAFEAVADELARRIGAERAVIQGAGHAVQSTGRPFNRRLEAMMSMAVA